VQQLSGLHIASAKDVAPFSSNKPVTVKKPSPEKRVSLILEEDMDEHITYGLSLVRSVDPSRSSSGVPLMTDDHRVGKASDPRDKPPDNDEPPYNDEPLNNDELSDNNKPPNSERVLDNE
jgi:hypothetical protein